MKVVDYFEDYLYRSGGDADGGDCGGSSGGSSGRGQSWELVIGGVVAAEISLTCQHVFLQGRVE